jgi:sugar/nucleoside kinase (ribokinase family)
MFHIVPPEPVDYLVVGHLTVDRTPTGPALGGSVAYAALTARALGLRVGIVTARGNEIELSTLGNIPVIAANAEHSTTFENIYTPTGRIQYIRHVAPRVEFTIIPEIWRRAGIVHIAPVAQEVDALLPKGWTPAFTGLTPQGWFRAWGPDGLVHPCPWSQSEAALPRATATVLGLEDVGGDEDLIEWMAQRAPLLIVTEGAAGCRLFWHGDVRRFRPPQVTEVDATGAGDIFATAFFIRLSQTRDPWEAARFATCVAAISVTRPGLQGVPTVAEARQCLIEILK